MDAFDADVLIYATDPDHQLGRRVRRLLEPVPGAGDDPVGLGSVFLLPEVLAKPRRTGRLAELEALTEMLGRLDLRPLSRDGADLATALSVLYGLDSADAVHLATAVQAGADRFITNNRRDFSRSIEEIDIVFPEDLPDPEA